MVLFLLFWATPSQRGSQWAKPVDNHQRALELQKLRDAAINNRASMDALERAASGGEMRRTLFCDAIRSRSQAQQDRSA